MTINTTLEDVLIERRELLSSKLRKLRSGDISMDLIRLTARIDEIDWVLEEMKK